VFVCGYGASSQSRISSKIGSLSLSGMVVVVAVRVACGLLPHEGDLIKENERCEVRADEGLSEGRSLLWEHCLVSADPLLAGRDDMVCIVFGVSDAGEEMDKSCLRQERRGESKDSNFSP
jgi:hypothetical protein